MKLKPVRSFNSLINVAFTLVTICPFPAWHADFRTIFGARIMAKMVISWPAEGRAACVIIIRTALNTVFVLEFCLVGFMDEVTPFWSHL